MVLPTETKAFLLSRPAQPGPRLVHTSGRVNHQTWLCPHKACCRPPCLPPACLPAPPLASPVPLSSTSPLLSPQLPFNCALLSLPCSLILRFLHAPPFPISPSSLQAQPPLPGVSISVQPTCLSFPRTSHSPGWILGHLSIPQQQFLPQPLLTGVGLLCSQQLCKEKRGSQGQQPKTVGDRETLPLLTGLLPHPIPSQWNLASEEKVGPPSTAPFSSWFSALSRTGSLPGPQKCQAPQGFWDCPRHSFLPECSSLTAPTPKANFSSSLKFWIPTLPFLGTVFSC